MNSLATSVAYLVQKYGTPLTRQSGASIKARVDEKADSVQKTFPNAFADYSSSGRIAVLRFDGSDAAKSLLQFDILTDSRSGIRWRLETFADDSDGTTLLARAALATIAPM